MLRHGNGENFDMDTGLARSIHFRLHHMQKNYARISPTRLGEDGLVQSVEEAFEEIIEVGTVGKVGRELVRREKEGDLEGAGFLDLWETARLRDDCFGPDYWRSDLPRLFRWL